jgi:hypothetical protein
MEIGNRFPPFWDFMHQRMIVHTDVLRQPTGPTIKGESPRRPLKMGPIGFPEMLVWNHHSSLCKHRSHLHGGRSQEEKKIITMETVHSGGST